MEPTLEYVKTLPLEDLYRHTLHDLKHVMRKRKRNQVYRKTRKGKEARRACYYKKNNIHDSTLNPDGQFQKHEKRKDIPEINLQYEAIKARARKRYYTKNDIYHPSLHPDGTIEKQHKRVNNDEHHICVM